MYSAHIILRADRSRKNGAKTIVLRIILNRKPKYYSLKIAVLSKDWNAKNEYEPVRKTDSAYEIKNKRVTKALKKARGIIDDYFLNDKHLNLETFDKLYNAEKYNNKCFYTFIETELANFGANFAKATHQSYKKELSKIKKFRKELTFNEIDVQFINQYQNYMVNDLGNIYSTVHRSLRFVRTVLYKAYQYGLGNEANNPFKRITLKNPTFKKEYLLPDEIKSIEEVYESGNLRENQKRVLCQFLFSCYTGLRISDVKQFNYKHIQQITISEKTYDIIVLVQQKTGDEVRIPIIERAKRFMKEGFEGNSFRVYTTQHQGRKLKECIVKAEIDKKITFHCARHTFAVNALLQGIKIEVIQSLMGHKDIKTTAIYAKVIDALRIAEIFKLDEI